MYKEYRLKIKPLSSYITPWQSDTFIGHLFWAIKYIEGDDFLEQLINESKNFNPPFIFSDGLLEKFLPKPDYPFLKRTELIKLGEKVFEKDSYTQLKKVKKINTICEDEFMEYINGCNAKRFIENNLNRLKNKEEIKVKSSIKAVNSTHNVINRLTGTTTENSLFTMVEYSIKGNLEFFIKLRKDFPIEKLENYINYVSLNGFGKKASTGKGAFEIISLEEFEGFSVKNPNAFMVLSNYIPKDGDYDETLSVKTLTKYGKVGGNEEELPFKKPFICFEKGSIFKGSPENIKGQLLEDLHYDKNIVQFGIPYIVEVRVDE
ncbi:MAG: hypothetical protein JXM74_00515 [Fusobacteriaceae bacterium]|nr:hypothetical protein [Fusobacteriaceae bacterium]